MLICGRVNPPPPRDPNYKGVYLGANDNFKKKAQSLQNKPIWIEHKKNTEVGRIVNGWVDNEGSIWALAELDTKVVNGAIAAAAVQRGHLGDFSLGYTVSINQTQDGKYNVGEKNIHEVSLVKVGARENCHIYHKEKLVKPRK